MNHLFSLYISTEPNTMCLNKMSIPKEIQPKFEIS